MNQNILDKIAKTISFEDIYLDKVIRFNFIKDIIIIQRKYNPSSWFNYVKMTEMLILAHRVSNFRNCFGEQINICLSVVNVIV